MFTGIIETTGTIAGIKKEKTNLVLNVEACFAPELKKDQSVAHNGVCLTVTSISGNTYSVTAVAETLARTNLGLLRVGDKLNLERAMPANGRFDGHIVQGHIDQTAVCTKIEDRKGSLFFEFKYTPGKTALIVPKGSIAVNGVSLTVASCKGHLFSVIVIPHTFAHTTFHLVKEGDVVNLEFDIIGKYAAAAQGL